MMKTLLVLVLALTAVSAAFAPRFRRLVNAEEELHKLNKTQICAKTTPCAWQVYEGSPERIIDYIQNTYCVCDAESVCKEYENDETGSAHILRCIRVENGESKTNS